MPNPFNDIALVYPDRPCHGAGANFQEMERRIGAVKKILSSNAACCACYSRAALPASFDNFDLVVTLGGDGTVLDAARRIQIPPLLPIRLFPETSVGFLCTVDQPAFSLQLWQNLRKAPVFQNRLRLQCLVGATPLPIPILNDALIAHRSPARASRYEIRWQDTAQAQCSSGIWIATPQGSHGGARASGAIPLPLTDSRALFHVRELAASSSQPAIHGAPFSPDTDVFTVTPTTDSLQIFLDGGLCAQNLPKNQPVSFIFHTPVAVITGTGA